jgi:uncharacterized membrane protein
MAIKASETARYYPAAVTVCFVSTRLFRQCLHNLYRLQAYSDDLADETNAVFAVVGAVEIVDDATAFIGRDLVGRWPTLAPSDCPAGYW